ncbi:MAG: hypothetical protein ACLSCV_12370 [Acutalibacteraceae bacterium]
MAILFGRAEIGKNAFKCRYQQGVQVIKRIEKDMNCMPMLIVITDGKGNVSLDENKNRKRSCGNW